MEDDVLDAAALSQPTPNTPPQAHIHQPTQNKDDDKEETTETHKINKNSFKSYVQSSIASYVTANATPTNHQTPHEPTRLARLQQEDSERNKPTHSKKVSTNPNSFSSFFTDSAARTDMSPSEYNSSNNMTDNTSQTKNKPLGTITLGTIPKRGPFNRRPPPNFNQIPIHSPEPTLSPTTYRNTPTTVQTFPARPTLPTVSLPASEASSHSTHPFKAPLPTYVLGRNGVTQVDTSFRVSTLLANLPPAILHDFASIQPTTPNNNEATMSDDVESSNEATPMSNMDIDSDVSTIKQTAIQPTAPTVNTMNDQTADTHSIAAPLPVSTMHLNSDNKQIEEPPTLQYNANNTSKFLATAIDTSSQHQSKQDTDKARNDTTVQETTTIGPNAMQNTDMEAWEEWDESLQAIDNKITNYDDNLKRATEHNTHRTTHNDEAWVELPVKKTIKPLTPSTFTQPNQNSTNRFAALRSNDDEKSTSSDDTNTQDNTTQNKPTNQKYKSTESDKVVTFNRHDITEYHNHTPAHKSILRQTVPPTPAYHKLLHLSKLNSNKMDIDSNDDDYPANYDTKIDSEDDKVTSKPVSHDPINTYQVFIKATNSTRSKEEFSRLNVISIILEAFQLSDPSVLVILPSTPQHQPQQFHVIDMNLKKTPQYRRLENQLHVNNSGNLFGTITFTSDIKYSTIKNHYQLNEHYNSSLK
jgi:hypothetical protein